jgi:tetrahydromethanopterin S-methyltransferase subunit F
MSMTDEQVEFHRGFIHGFTIGMLFAFVLLALLAMLT